MYLDSDRVSLWFATAGYLRLAGLRATGDSLVSVSGFRLVLRVWPRVHRLAFYPLSCLVNCDSHMWQILSSLTWLIFSFSLKKKEEKNIY